DCNALRTLSESFSDVVGSAGSGSLQAFATKRSNEALAKGIGLGSLGRRLQDSNPEAAEREIHIGRKDRVTIMDDESVRMIEGEKLTKLLSSPFGGRMVGDIEVQNSPGIDLYGDRHVQDLEVESHHRKEITGHDGLDVITHESCPSLA